MPARASKRLKTSPSTATTTMETPSKHTTHTSWAESRGISISGVVPASLPGRGIGLVATRRIKSGQRIIFVPAKAMLQPDLALLKKLKLHNASPQAQLTASLMARDGEKDEVYEMARSVWPTWEDFEACMLCSDGPDLNSNAYYGVIPPSVKSPLDRLLKDLKRDVDDISAAFSAADLKADKQTLLYHWTIANTRSFHWKPAGKKQGSMVVCPFLDYTNHCPSGQGCEVSMTTDGYTMTANRVYEEGEEIYATYGAHPNDKLLVHYGFVLPSSSDRPNNDDEVRLDHVILPRLSQAQQDALRDVGYLGGYGLIPATNEVCYKTQVAVRSVLLTSNEWEYYIGFGEDLADSKDEEVKRWLTPALEEYLEEAEHAIAKCQDRKQNAEGATKAKLELLEMRWVQIQDALKGYLGS